MLFFGNKLKKWAQENNLNYRKKVKLGLISSENVALRDLIWGEYKGERIYVFMIDDNTGIITQRFFFVNGSFYSKLKPEYIDEILKNTDYLDQCASVFGHETDVEIVQIIVAHIYLKEGLEVEYDDAKNIYRLLKKFYKTKTTLKDKLIGKVIGGIRKDIKFNDSEVIEFVLNNDSKLDKVVVIKVTDMYEELLGAYNK